MISFQSPPSPPSIDESHISKTVVEHKPQLQPPISIPVPQRTSSLRNVIISDEPLDVVHEESEVEVLGSPLKGVGGGLEQGNLDRVESNQNRRQSVQYESTTPSQSIQLSTSHSNVSISEPPTSPRTIITLNASLSFDLPRESITTSITNETEIELGSGGDGGGGGANEERERVDKELEGRKEKERMVGEEWARWIREGCVKLDGELSFLWIFLFFWVL